MIDSDYSNSSTPTHESPFHLRGYIGPQDQAAWSAMKWHSELIENVVRDLDQTPPEYVLIRGPALGGKTTFAMQLIDRLVKMRPEILTVYLPLGGANATHARFLDEVRDGLRERLTEWLEVNGDIQDQYPDLKELLDSWANLKPDNLAELLRAMLWQVPDEFRRVVFLVDDSENLPPGHRELVADELRSIYAVRRLGVLSRFSVVVLAKSLLRYPSLISPLADLVKEYRLDDWTLEETQHFLNRCGSILSGLTFETEAVRYLHYKTAGQAVAIQRICSSATRKKAAPSAVNKADILDGICECFEAGGGFVDRLLNLDSLLPEAKITLNRMLRGHEILPFELDPSVSQLMDLGLGRISNEKRCVCRSPLLRELIDFRYMMVQDRPRLSKSDARLLDLPQVMPLLCDDPLFDEICAEHPSNHLGFSGVEAEDSVKASIERRFPEIDIAGIQHCVRKYFGDEVPSPSTEDVLRVIAKVYLHWCRHEH